MNFQTAIRLSMLALLVAFQANPALGQSASSVPQDKRPVAAIEILTDTEGVDFNEYFRGLYLAIKAKLYAGMPSSVALGESGLNVIQFRVLQDGAVPEDFMKLRVGSGKRDLDDASLQAIRKAAPFKHLPEKYSQPFIELRINFNYNVPKKPQ